MILVVGSTGMVGGEACRLLAAEGLPVRAMVRATADQAKVETLKALGAEVVTGDLREPDSLRAACQGVEAVICTVSAMPTRYVAGVNDLRNVDQDGLIALIDAAKAAGVQHFVYTSFTHSINLDIPLCDAKRAVEKYLSESGLKYTILLPGNFMEAWLSPMVGFDPLNAKAQIYGSGDQKVNFISYRDVARFAVESLRNPAAINAALELGGPDNLSVRQVVAVFEQAMGKPFELSFVPEEALEIGLMGAEEPMQKSFAGLMLAFARGSEIDMEETLRRFPIQMITLQQYAQEVQSQAHPA